MTQVQNLFTELTSEQAATVEGGFFLLIDQIHCLKADADLLGKDDTYIKINGTKIWGKTKMGSGDTKTVNRGLEVGNTGRVRLFDDDLWPNNDEYLGGFNVYSSTNGVQKTAFTTGAGSKYEVYYRAFG